MSKKGRPPPPPKPEELIEILERKFEEFKVEMLESLQSKSSQILKLEEADTELKSSTEGQFTEIKDILESLKDGNAQKLVEIKENQEIMVFCIFGNWCYIFAKKSNAILRRLL